MPHKMGELAPIASKRNRADNKGHTVKKSEASARQRMKERGMPTPTYRQVRATHKRFTASGPRVSKPKGKKKAA